MLRYITRYRCPRIGQRYVLFWACPIHHSSGLDHTMRQKRNVLRQALTSSTNVVPLAIGIGVPAGSTKWNASVGVARDHVPATATPLR